MWRESSKQHIEIPAFDSNFTHVFRLLRFYRVKSTLHIPQNKWKHPGMSRIRSEKELEEGLEYAKRVPFRPFSYQ